MIRNPAVKWVFFALFAALFAADLWLVVTGRIQPFDEAILKAIISTRTDLLTIRFMAVTFCGNSWTVVGLCIFIVILPGRMKIGIPVSLAVAAGSLVQTIFKTLVARPRPDAAGWLVEESTYSFPSGHSNISIIFWVALLVLLGRVLISKDRVFAAVFLQICFAALAVLIGFSRMYLGVHYPSDVLGGWLLAGALLIVFFAVYDNIWPAKWRVPAGVRPRAYSFDLPATLPTEF